MLLRWLLDGLLAAALLWLAWQTLASSDLFKAIVLFVAYGFLMALVWVRLEAPDLALAEAAIGAGLTGALLLAAWARLRDAQPSGAEPSPHERCGNGVVRLTWLAGPLVIVVAAGLAYVASRLPAHGPGLGGQVAASLGASGVSHPVTAVLLNFRGYDTLLEMTVLLTALLGTWSLGPAPESTQAPPGRVLDTLTRSVLPAFVLVAAYLLWVGAHAPGGAFQAGSVLGAAGVLQLLAGWTFPARATGWPLRAALAAGAAAFVAVALWTLLAEGRLLEFPRDMAGGLILMLETSASLSIGATLTALFLGGRPAAGRKET